MIEAVSDPTWRFRPMAPAELNIDPVEEEFFTTEALEDMSEALVREAIQNSLDAARGEEAVLVRFALAWLSDERAQKRFLDPLLPHLEAVADKLDFPEKGGPCTFLTVEDFGTRGLEGDCRQLEDTAGQQSSDRRTRNDFYYFWRNVGRSAKGLSERGRWGLGKTVFPACSRIRAFFGLTVRLQEPRVLLMGKAVLWIHRLNATRFAPYGYWAVFEDEVPYPVSEGSHIRRFSEAFGLTRKESEPGLSVVIPYPDPEITEERLIEAVLRQYFFPIVEGRLIVEIRDRRGEWTRIDARTIPEVAEKRLRGRKRRYLGLIRLAMWIHGPQGTEPVELKAPAPNASPQRLEECIEGNALADLRRLFESCRPIALKIPLFVHRARERRGGRRRKAADAAPEPVKTFFELYMQRDEDLGRGEGFFVRQGITIENPTVVRPPGVRWIVNVSDAALATFLGDAENPAHTEWQRNARSLKQRYTYGPSTVDYVRSAPRRMVALLTRQAAKEDRGLLRSIFSLPLDQGQARAVTGEGAAEAAERAVARAEAVPELAPAQKSFLSVLAVENGFSLLGKQDRSGSPRELSVTVAYEVNRGDPFKRYSPLDFELNRSPIRLRCAGCRIAEVGFNRLRLTVTQPAFELEVSGFDPNRDLRVRIIEVGSKRVRRESAIAGSSEV